MGSRLDSYPKYECLQNAVILGKAEFKAGGERKSAVNLKYDRTLAVSGYYIDIIDELGPTFFDISHQSNGGIVYEIHHFAVNYNKRLRRQATLKSVHFQNTKTLLLA